MRFAILPLNKVIFYMQKQPRDWPLGMRFFALIFPLIVCIIIVSSFTSYYTTQTIYTQSSALVPLIKAKAIAHKMQETIISLRDNLIKLSANSALTAKDIQYLLPLIFQENLGFIVEIGIKNNSGKGFMLLRNQESFREVNSEEVSQGPYSAFQQVTSLPLRAGEVTIFPAVKAAYSSSPTRDRVEHMSIMRLALPLADQSGVLIIGINLELLKKPLSEYTKHSSPLNVQSEKEAFQLAYFFDASGWILFEMSSTENNQVNNTTSNPNNNPENNSQNNAQNIGLSQHTAKSSSADMARRGYTGDLGRAGLDSAFRPWAVHEGFWSMVQSILSNSAGSVPTSAAYYSTAHAQDSAALCFAPVTFAPQKDHSQTIIGGIAYIETTTVPQAALTQYLADLFFLLAVAGFVSLLFFYLIQKIFAKPLYDLAKGIKKILDFGDYAAIEQRSVFQEHQMLLVASNGLIAQAMSMQATLARVQGEAYHARSKQPVDLTQSSSTNLIPITAESGMVGSSVAMNQVREQIKKAARAGTDLLVWGETGTGKELVVEAIHHSSSRKDHPLISINCGALDEHLLLDALFGHAKGAFTEAKSNRKGAFLSAENGTLHLDEIANASLQVQQALLRALSVRRIRPLGTDTEIPFNTRVIAATNLDLRESVKEGTFREDLYYRLAIISIKTPPLRLRKEDIYELAAYYLQECAIRMNKPNLEISRGALETLIKYQWPGNVREFKNCIMRAAAFTEGNLILSDHIVHNESEQTDFIKISPRYQEKVSQGYQEKETFTSSMPYSNPNVQQSEIAAPKELNIRQAKAWPIIVQQKGITRAEYQESTGEEVSPRTAQHDLKELTNLGILEKVGSGPKTRYILKKE